MYAAFAYFYMHATDDSSEISSEAAKAYISAQTNDTLDSHSFSDPLLGKMMIGGFSGIVCGAIAGIVWQFRRRNLPSSDSSSQQSSRKIPNCVRTVVKQRILDQFGTSEPDGSE